MTACDERAVWPASHAPLRREEENEEEEDIRGVSEKKTNPKGTTWVAVSLFWILPF